MKIFRFLPIAFAIVLGLSSCGDENSAIGSSIVDTNIEIVVDSSFQELSLFRMIVSLEEL